MKRGIITISVGAVVGCLAGIWCVTAEPGWLDTTEGRFDIFAATFLGALAGGTFLFVVTVLEEIKPRKS